MSANCARRIYTILPRRCQGNDRPGPARSGVLEVSDDRLMQIFQALAVLLFVSVGALALGRAGPAWVKWAKWGSIVIFATAVMYALVLTLRWALNPATD
jgi:hypothetical protein